MAYTNYEILAKMFAQVSSGWLRSWWPSVTIETETDTTTAAKEVRDTISCPYNYILSIYGSAHFTKIIKWLDPTLEEKDPSWFALILEIMDAIHFGAILVDDVADGSMLRKGRTAAHHIYGSSETINRAYLRIFEVVEKCRAAKPSAVPFILDNLTEIHKGQDDSLVWRRDGFNLSVDQEEALALYRECASLKTGALFRLVGQLVTGNHVKDRIMSSFGWYCQLQNDCKNIFSSDVIAAKGALAEDLANGEYSYPILVGLYASPSIREAVESALHRFGGTIPHFHDRVARATVMLQRPEVRGRCLAELAALREENKDLATLWGRREDMVVDCSRLSKSGSDGGLRSLTFWGKVLYAA